MPTLPPLLISETSVLTKLDGARRRFIKLDLLPVDHTRPRRAGRNRWRPSLERRRFFRQRKSFSAQSEVSVDDLQRRRLGIVMMIGSNRGFVTAVFCVVGSFCRRESLEARIREFVSAGFSACVSGLHVSCSVSTGFSTTFLRAAVSGFVSASPRLYFRF